MKILHIVPDLHIGGAERLVIDIVGELAGHRDIEVRMVIFRDKVEYPVSEIKDHIHIVPSSIDLSILGVNKYNVFELQDFVDTFQPDIINSHLFEAEIISRCINYPRAKWFSHCHSNTVVFRKPGWSILTDKTSFTRAFERAFIIKRYDKNGGNHFIAVSRDTMRFIQENLKYPVTLLPNAINLSRTKPKESKEKRDILTLVNIGSFVKNKNQQLLLHIVKEIQRRGVSCNCIFLGAGPEEKNVKQLAQDLGISGQIRFEGNVTDVSAYLSQGDIYVHTALSESFGLVLIEAMACGLPVVSLDSGGNRDILENGINGYILPEQNVNTFADHIIDLYNDRSLNDRITQNGFASAKKYDIRTYVSKLLDIYNQDTAKT